MLGAVRSTILKGAGGNSYSPAQLTNIDAWIDASYGPRVFSDGDATTQANDGQKAASIVDRINGYKFYNTNINSQPVYRMSEGALEYDLDGLGVGPNPINFPGSASIFIVFNPAVSTQSYVQSLFSIGNSGAPTLGVMACHLTTTGKVQTWASDGSTSWITSTTPSISANTIQLAESRFNSATKYVEVLLNNASLAQALTTTSTLRSETFYATYIGARNNIVGTVAISGSQAGFSGKIYEVIVVKDLVTGAQRTDLMKYFQSKYGLSLGV